MDKNIVIKTWILRGIEDFFISFSVGWNWEHHRAFLLTLGTEKFLKAYILGKHATEYEKLDDEKQSRKLIK